MGKCGTGEQGQLLCINPQSGILLVVAVLLGMALKVVSSPDVYS